MACSKGMDEQSYHLDQRRNRNFAETHRQLIERAVTLIDKEGVAPLSVSSLARDAGMNRSTVYYHFESREALLASVKQWVGMRLSDALLGVGDPALRLERTLEFAMGHPVVVHLWVMDLIDEGPIRERLPFWDVLVGAMQRGQAQVDGTVRGDPADAEVWAVSLLSVALMGTRVYKSAIRPEESPDVIARRFARAFGWLLGQLSAKR